MRGPVSRRSRTAPDEAAEGLAKADRVPTCTDSPTPPTSQTCAAARAGEGTARDRHRVHVRGPLPRAAVPHAGRGRGPQRAHRHPHDPDRRARSRASTCGRWRELLADPGVEIVLHAGRQDVAILRRAWATQLTNVFDTQIAAGFVGESAQSGYGNLLSSVLGLRVGKTASYTRWDARPLTGEQLSYAAEDVAHLLQLADELQRPAERDRPVRVGDRGVPAARDRHRRARPRDRLGAPAARGAARPAGARGRQAPGRLA